MLGYSKQAYYKRQHTMEEKRMNEELILELVKAKRKLWKKGSGRNLLAALQTDFREHSIKMHIPVILTPRSGHTDPSGFRF